jgi:3-oxoacyl-[acyl-carrier-protein] synthase II
LGAGAELFWGGLAAGRAAVGRIRSFDTTAFPVHVAGEVPVPATTRDRKISWAVLAAAEAWSQARCGIAERGAWLAIALGLEQAFPENFGSAQPLRSPVDAAVPAVQAALGIDGPAIVHVSACAAGALAVAHAASLIERGAAPIVVAGGADSMVNPLGIGAFSRLGALSPRAEPDACRPFDRRRDGLVIGEGAAMFVVEDEARARARGARLLARVAGWGSTQDAYKATAPRPDGKLAARAIARALERARARPADVAYVNAHGTGTPQNDPAECAALRAAFGAAAEKIPTSSIKGAVGHLMAASGAIELAACLLPLARGVVPGTAHLRERDPDCDLDIVGQTPRSVDVPLALSTSFGFGGQNAAVLLARPDYRGGS